MLSLMIRELELKKRSVNSNPKFVAVVSDDSVWRGLPSQPAELHQTRHARARDCGHGDLRLTGEDGYRIVLRINRVGS